MKKAGIMTIHYIDNYGSVLQCYALRHTINSFTDIEAEVINYACPGWKPISYTDDYIQKKYMIRLEKFKEFRAVYHGIEGPLIYDTDDIIKKYDYYITGSDQVWNTHFRNTTEAYFLNFVPCNAKRISYAASVGLPVSSPELKLEWFERNIHKFDHISLREKTHIPFISQFTDKEVCSVLDPTLLLTVDDYAELCKGTSHPDGDYLFLYLCILVFLL